MSIFKELGGGGGVEGEGGGGDRDTDTETETERETERDRERQRGRQRQRERERVVRGARWQKRFPFLRETRKKQKILMLICRKIHGDMGQKCRAIIT